MAGKPLFLLSEKNTDWASQLLYGASPDDVLVASPEMAPFLTDVSPFIRVYFSRYVQSGAVYRMQDKAAELLMKGMQDDEKSDPSDGKSGV